MGGFKIVRDEFHKKINQEMLVEIPTLEGQVFGDYLDGNFRIRLNGGDEDLMMFEIVMDSNPFTASEKDVFEPLDILATTFDVNEMYAFNPKNKRYELM